MDMTTGVKKTAPTSTLILLVIGVDALVIVAACALDRASQINLSWLLVPAAMLMTVLLGSWRLGDQAALALNDLVAIASAVLLGPTVAVLAAAFNHLLFCRGRREGKDRILFGIAGSVVAMNAATQAMAAAFAPLGLAQNELTVSAAVVAAACCAALYFALATALSATYRALSTGEPLVAALKDSALWNAAHLPFARTQRASAEQN